MAFKLNRPFTGTVATFVRPSEFFDWLVFYDATSQHGVSGMIWNDDKPVNTVAMVLIMGRDAFLTKYDPTYESDAPVTKSSLAAAVAEAAGISVEDLGIVPCDPTDLRGTPMDPMQDVNYVGHPSHY
jgi:hypothetical protein